MDPGQCALPPARSFHRWAELLCRPRGKCYRLPHGGCYTGRQHCDYRLRGRKSLLRLRPPKGHSRSLDPRDLREPGANMGMGLYSGGFWDECVCDPRLGGLRIRSCRVHVKCHVLGVRNTLLPADDGCDVIRHVVLKHPSIDHCGTATARPIPNVLSEYLLPPHRSHFDTSNVELLPDLMVLFGFQRV